MVFAILSVLLMIVTNFVFQYAFDIFNLYKVDTNSTLGAYKPSIFDLNDKATDYDKDWYVRDVIIPSSFYFYNVLDIEKKQEMESITTLIYPFSIETPLVILLVNGLCKLEINLHRVIIIGMSILICIVIGYVISKIYKKSRLTADGFTETREEILRYFSVDKDSKVLESAQINNYLIDQHCRYIIHIKASVQKRYISRKILDIIAIVSYTMSPLLLIFKI